MLPTRLLPQAGAQLDALALPAAERGTAAVEGEVSQPHVQQELEPVAHFEQEALSDFLFGVGQLEALKRWQDLFDGQGQQVGQGMSIDAHVTGFGLSRLPPQCVQAVRAAVPAEHHTVLDLVALGLEDGEEVVNALPRPRAVPQLALLLRRQVRIGRVDRKVEVVGILQQALLVAAGLFAPPWGHAVVVDTFGRVGNDQVLADADDVPEAFAFGASALAGC